MPKVLVVDDSPVDRRLVQGLLEKDASLTVECSENGSDALARMDESLPELVLTDMQMPDMNGLELVVTTRLQYPDVPIVLMTAHGSESLAVEALEQGAASYVPKSRLSEKLLSTVDEVLTCTRAEQKNEKLISCLKRATFAYELDNDLALIDPLVETVQEVIAGMKLLGFNERVRFGVAFKAALLNSMFWGNLELNREQMAGVRKHVAEGQEPPIVRQRSADPVFRDRRVHVDVQVDRDQARVVIGDDGPGFDVSRMPNMAVPQALEEDQGRGLWLIRSFMDEVSFNRGGSEITMVKHREVPGASA
jgi:CheY-like chemotaxis protein